MAEIAPTLGRYEVRFRLAQGGMGSVYLGRARGIGGIEKVVAIKTLHSHLAHDDSLVRMFLDEARLSAAINHPNVCTVFDFGEQDGTHYMVMEYLDGEPLQKVFKHFMAKPEGREELQFFAARVIADAAEGLHAAHELKGSDGEPLEVVHRDISPHNIFITYDGAVKVVDFGVAHARKRMEETRAGEIKGKYEYLSPEQVTNKKVDRRTDVWALGICLWELLTLQRLFRREGFHQTLSAVVREDLKRPSELVSGVAPELDALVMRMLSKDPAERPTSAREVSRALRGFLTQRGKLIDATEIGEWLAGLFPDDRKRRLAQQSAVRSAQAAPESVEPLPQDLSVGSGISRTLRPGSPSQPGPGFRPSAPESMPPPRSSGSAVRSVPLQPRPAQAPPVSVPRQVPAPAPLSAPPRPAPPPPAPPPAPAPTEPGPDTTIDDEPPSAPTILGDVATLGGGPPPPPAPSAPTVIAPPQRAPEPKAPPPLARTQPESAQTLDEEPADEQPDEPDEPTEKQRGRKKRSKAPVLIAAAAAVVLGVGAVAAIAMLATPEPEHPAKPTAQAPQPAVEPAPTAVAPPVGEPAPAPEPAKPPDTPPEPVAPTPAPKPEPVAPPVAAAPPAKPEPVAPPPKPEPVVAPVAAAPPPKPEPVAPPPKPAPAPKPEPVAVAPPPKPEPVAAPVKPAPPPKPEPVAPPPKVAAVTPPPKPTPKPEPVVKTPPKPEPAKALNPAATSTGRIRLRTLHGSAEVLIDGKSVGHTPLTLDVPAGPHTVELKAPGVFLAPQQLTVRFAAEYNIEVDLAN